MTIEPKRLTAEELQEIQAFRRTNYMLSFSDIDRLLAHIAALEAELEKTRAGLRLLRNECKSEFTVDGEWCDTGQLVRKSTFDAASNILWE